MVILTQEQLDSIRKELVVAMDQHMCNIDEWLWEDMEIALKSDRALYSLFEQNYDPLLKNIGINPIVKKDMELLELLNAKIEIDTEIENYFKDEDSADLKTCAGALFIGYSITENQLLEAVVIMKEIKERDVNMKDNSALLKILMNYRDAYKVVFGSNTTGWLRWLIFRDKTSKEIFYDFYERGTQDDIRNLTKKFFIYSLRESKFYDGLNAKNIDYSYLNENWLKGIFRRIKRRINLIIKGDIK